MKFFWVVTLIITALCGWGLAATAVFAKGAPQEAAGYAMICAWTVVPYVFTRALEALNDATLQQRIERLAIAIEKQNRLTEQS